MDLRIGRVVMLAIATLTPIRLHGQATAPVLLADAPRVEASLTEITPQDVEFRIGTERSRRRWDEVVVWGWPRSNAISPQLVARTGEVLVGELSALTTTDCRILTPLFGEISVSREQVAGIMVRPPTELLDRDQLRRQIGETKLQQDLIVLNNGDEIEGPCLTPESTAGEVATSITMGPAKTPASVANVMTIFGRQQNAGPNTATGDPIWVGLRDGSRLAVRSIGAQGSRWDFDLSCGFRVSAEKEEWLQEIVWLQPPAKRFTFLSSMKPAGYRHLPFFQKSWDLGLDQNVLGGALRSGGHEYSTGIGMHSASRVTYDLRGEYRRFEADLALDDAAGNRGAVIFRVFLDRGTDSQTSRWELAYESPVVRGTARPIPLSLDVHQAVRMAVVIDFSERGEECDYANWLHARLLK